MLRSAHSLARSHVCGCALLLLPEQQFSRNQDELKSLWKNQSPSQSIAAESRLSEAQKNQKGKPLRAG